MGSISSATTANNKPLTYPALLDATEVGKFELTVQSGSTNFTGMRDVPTIGFNGTYLGPTIRLKNGAVAAKIKNTINEPVTVHWHGLLVPGDADGGPHLPIAPGGIWSPELPINQAPATTWYHTHIHERTAVQVHAGLAGAMQISDDLDDDRGLPTRYGVDDLMLVLQDRRFDEAGRMVYLENMMDVMHGFTGDTMLVNGQIGRTAVVPKGVVRLRLLNGSNARTYTLKLSDGRGMHLIATDGGLLSKPVLLSQLQLASGERAEILVDFTEHGSVQLLSTDDPNQGPGGMMGRLRQILEYFGRSEFTILEFAVDSRMPSSIQKIPDHLDGNLPELNAKGIVTRRFSLDIGMGFNMMGQGMMGKMTINDRSFDMDRIDHEAKLGSTERWIIDSDVLAHPFHIHGAMFQVTKEDGAEPKPEHLGWKDTVLVENETELLVRFDHRANQNKPYMFHCHILEHEDAGMMGQFVVT